jgi:preprotein translocase subunit SecG
MIAGVIALHVIVCITLVIVVLLQQGKGADVGAVFGGSSSTVFGGSTAGNPLTKVTWACAAVFFATSIFLAYASTRRVTGSIFEGNVPLPARSSAPAGRAPAVLPPSGAPLSSHGPGPAQAPTPKK